MATTKADLRPKLEEANESVQEARGDAQTKWAAWEQARDEFAAAGNDANRTDSDEFKKVEATHKEYSEAADELAEREGFRDKLIGLLGTDAPEAHEPRDRGINKGSRVTPDMVKSLGQAASASDEYKALLASGALSSGSKQAFNAKIAESSREAAEDVLRGGPSAALITGVSDTSAGAFVTPDRKAYVEQPRQPMTLLDLIAIGSTDSDLVEYVRQSAFTNVAAETAEATTTTTGTKPEATMTFAIVQEAVKTIAHWIPATRRALADAGQLRTLIDSQLRYGLNLRLQGQVANGNGSGENLTGLLQQSGILSQAKSSDSIADAFHKAITQLRLGYIEPTGAAMHPTDWEVVRLSKATGGSEEYFYGPPSIQGPQTLWGLPVAVTAAIPDDTGLVGAFNFAVLWLREGIQVLASDSHDDFFVKNLVVLLAELRAAFGVLLPAAFCKVTGLD
jgi:HK97 family phage major capsid protein